MGVFFIDTAQGTVATLHQLVASGVATAAGVPPRPWLRIQGSGDASTMWYAVMRKRERGVFIGTLVLRHSPHHALLIQQGWEEIAPETIGPTSASPLDSISG
jgi:type IV secretory pathway protease TraF